MRKVSSLKSIARLFIGILLLAAVLIGMESSMALGKTFVLCSPFSGVLVTKGGEPAGGVRLERTWQWGWNSKSGSDVAVTGPDGRFSFAEVTGSSLLASFAPHEPSVMQSITAQADGRQVEIWNANKRNYEMDGELDGRPIDVVCHLDREPSADGLFWGTCEEAK
jgi:hypothetical protein